MASGYENDRNFYQRERANQIAVERVYAQRRIAKAQERIAKALEALARRDDDTAREAVELMSETNG